MSNRQFKWQDRYEIGVEIIDREHKKLFSIMNKLLAYSDDESKGQWVCQEGIKYFKEHAMKHFAEEEVYMATIGYAGYETHRRLHDYFRKHTIPEIEAELSQTNYSQDSIHHFLGVCAGWLIAHTLTEDRAITGKAASKWDHLLPDDEQAAMKQLIIQLLDELFQLNARILSNSYNGERFGKGVYYRLVYTSSNKKIWENYFIFEEKLLVSTAGKLLGSSSDTLNVMMMNATRYIARQFMERIRAHFGDSGEFELKEENLLTYEAFQKLYNRQNPQCSLLFDTGEGYFAYGAIAAGRKGDSGAAAIRAENATSEIKKYLNNSHKDCRKKILLVDDSSVIRQSLTMLLDKDYEVTAAKSGFSAIRCMSLDRPDLVLLDYEMPVCDGAQVLEMIRAEEDLADTPVIFLSGTLNKERLAKTAALNPSGYLLKSMKPEELKHSVDSFFRK